MPYVSWLVTGLSLWRPWFVPGQCVCGICGVQNGTRSFFSGCFGFTLVSMMLPMLHTDSPIHHMLRHCSNLQSS